MADDASSIERGHQLALMPEAAPAQAPARAPGRPPGAINRRSRHLGKWLAAKGYSDPAEALAAIYSLPVDPEGGEPRTPTERLADKVAELRSTLGISADEALSAIRNAATAAMPYHHAKKPVSVQVDAPIPLVLADPGVMQAASGGDQEAMSTLEAEIIDMVENPDKSGTYEEGGE